MKRAVVVVALITVCAIRLGAQQKTGKFFVIADELAIDCRASNRVMDGPSPSTTSDLNKGDACVNYIRGVMDSFESARLWHWSPNSESICKPATFNTDQAVRMFVKYADEHPEALNNSAPSMVWDALHKSFPCAGH